MIELFNRFADGERLPSIISDFTEREIKTTRGNYFSKNTVQSTLKNRIYIGEYHYRDVVTPGGVPQIINNELFERVQNRIQKNKYSPAHSKAKVEYILTTKLFCGNCGTYMVGESGTSCTGSKYNYYKCAKTKNKKGCHKKAIRKEFIEDFVVLQTQQYVLVDEVIEKIADELVEYQKSENTTLPLLKNELAETEKGINNVLNAIQSGMLNSSLKERMDFLETEKEKLKLAILKEESMNKSLSREQIIHWISTFKNGSNNDLEYKRNLIDCFVNSVYVFNDKIIINYNSDKKEYAYSLKEINSAFPSSNTSKYAPPI